MVPTRLRYTYELLELLGAFDDPWDVCIVDIGSSFELLFGGHIGDLASLTIGDKLPG